MPCIYITGICYSCWYSLSYIFLYLLYYLRGRGEDYYSIHFYFLSIILLSSGMTLNCL
nr:MAG TPA: hypothetical protein [Caudoviricetes sp.]